MGIEKIIFYLFAAIVIAAASLVITSRDTVRSVLFLVLAFVGSAGLWLLLEAEYLALLLILVYVGAVMVLFLFVVMMLDLNQAPLKEGYARYMPLALVIASLMIGQLIWALTRTTSPNIAELASRAADYNSVALIGEAIFTEYIYVFELAGVLLLVAMIAAVSLTFRGIKKRKGQNPADQVKVRASDRVRLIDLE